MFSPVSVILLKGRRWVHPVLFLSGSCLGRGRDGTLPSTKWPPLPSDRSGLGKGVPLRSDPPPPQICLVCGGGRGRGERGYPNQVTHPLGQTGWRDKDKGQWSVLPRNVNVRLSFCSINKKVLLHDCKRCTAHVTSCPVQGTVLAGDHSSPTWDQRLAVPLPPRKRTWYQWPGEYPLVDRHTPVKT